MELNSNGFLRPVFETPLTREESSRTAERCPAISLDLQPEAGVAVHPEWGPLVQVRTGWSTDPEIRHRGSSGGAITALAVHLLESREVDFVAHVQPSTSDPFGNELHLSRTRDEMLLGTGSRYSPVAPLKNLDRLFATGERFAFVGKPCDVAGLKSYIAQNPDLAPQLMVTISFMCAGQPSRQGTHAVLSALGVRPDEVTQFRYRGNGWPGFATADLKDGRTVSMDYDDSWGRYLGRHLQLRCKLCPDGTGEFADIVGADAWYVEDGKPTFGERDGRSLILSRTSAGERVVQKAAASGDLEIQSASADEIAAMQPYQFERKQTVLGRWFGFVVGRRVVPRLSGLRLQRTMWRGGFVPALRQGWGTLRRLGDPTSR